MLKGERAHRRTGVKHVKSRWRQGKRVGIYSYRFKKKGRRKG